MYKIQPWEVSENSTSLVKELYAIKDMVLNFAKKNNVHVDMFVPKEPDVLSLTVSRINSVGKPDALSKATGIVKLTSEPVTMVKEFLVMLENKDGLNYMAKGRWSTEDNFIRQVYRAVGDLTGKLLTK
ncbi:MAG: hypothetical protein K2F57_05325 [Candidatus Gastranaerophilales bacterium]|nr:hypothetical protein [Candidatus Gastranaerophilales bacterium]